MRTPVLWPRGYLHVARERSEGLDLGLMTPRTGPVIFVVKAWPPDGPDPVSVGEDAPQFAYASFDIAVQQGWRVAEVEAG
jgi:hypothetical protein